MGVRARRAVGTQRRVELGMKVRGSGSSTSSYDTRSPMFKEWVSAFCLFYLRSLCSASEDTAGERWVVPFWSWR